MNHSENKKSHNKIPSNWQRPRFVVAVLMIVAFGTAGAVVVQRSLADPYSDNIQNQTGGVYFNDEKRFATYQAGQSFFLTMYTNPPQGAGHLDLEVVLSSVGGARIAQFLDPPGLRCESLGACSYFASRPSERSYDFGVCIDVNATLYNQKRIPAITITYKKLLADPQYQASISALWYGGRCKDATGHGYGYQNPGQPRLTSGIPNQSPSVFGMGGGGQGTDLAGDSSSGGGAGVGDDGKDKGNKGGSGGGSSATKQSSTSSPVPSSSSQGTADSQTKVEPSPFFDGKEYKPGSDIDSGVNIGNVGGFIKGRSPLRLLGLLASILVVAGLAFLGYRRMHRAR